MKRTFLPLPLLIFCLSACGQMEELGSMVSGGLDQAMRLGQAAKDAVAPDLTPEREYYLGRAVSAQILARYPAAGDDRANTYLNRLGQGLALYSAMPETYAGYHFLLLDTPEVNAFAAPGGFIFVTQGMLGLLSSEGELAAVLAHEIAHVQNKDAVGAIRNARLTETLTEVGKGAARRYTAGRVNPQIFNAFSDCIGDVTTTLVTRGYSRSQEYAADAAAREMLTQAGYDPRGLYAVLEVMRQRVPEGSAGFGSTHPSPAQRLEALKVKDTKSAPDPQARGRRFQAALGAYSAR